MCLRVVREGPRRAAQVEDKAAPNPTIPTCAAQCPPTQGRCPTSREDTPPDRKQDGTPVGATGAPVASRARPRLSLLASAALPQELAGRKPHLAPEVEANISDAKAGPLTACSANQARMRCASAPTTHADNATNLHSECLRRNAVRKREGANSRLELSTVSLRRGGVNLRCTAVTSSDDLRKRYPHTSC